MRWIHSKWKYRRLLISMTIEVKMVVFSCPQVGLHFQTPIRFQAVKQVLILEYVAGRSTFLIELDVRKPLVVSLSRRSEELRLNNLV